VKRCRELILTSFVQNTLMFCPLTCKGLYAAILSLMSAKRWMEVNCSSSMSSIQATGNVSSGWRALCTVLYNVASNELSKAVRAVLSLTKSYES